MKQKIILSLLGLMATQSFGIIAVTPIDIGEQQGVHGEIAGSFYNSDGNSQKTAYELAGKAQYDTSKNVTFMILNRGYETKKSDNYRFHVRHISDVFDSQVVVLEAFGQYSKNSYNNEQHRTIAGAGARWRVYDGNYGKGYIGQGLFANEENIKNEGTYEGVRSNTYLGYSYKGKVDIDSMFYYQPKLQTMGDYDLYGFISLSKTLDKQFKISALYSYEFDSRPAPSVQKDDASLKIVFGYKF